MELVDGRDLAAEIHACGVLPPERAAAIAARIASAVGAAHAHGIVHRDLKPENVLLVDQGPSEALLEGSVKVLDFGIAKVSGAVELVSARQGALEPRITAFGQLLGTPEYMSPEQCGPGSVGPESDVYSLGVMLYEMCTGVLPFEADSPIELVRLHTEETPRSPGEIEPGLPPALVAIIERCLAKRAEDRFRSMAELEAALCEIAAPVPRAAPVGVRAPLQTLRPEHTVASAPPAQPRRRPNAVTAVAASVALAAGSLITLAVVLGARGGAGARASEAPEASELASDGEQRVLELGAFAAAPAEPEPPSAARPEVPREPAPAESAAVPGDGGAAPSEAVGTEAEAEAETETEAETGRAGVPGVRRRSTPAHADDPSARPAARRPPREASPAAAVAQPEREVEHDPPRSRILDQFIDPWDDPS